MNRKKTLDLIFTLFVLFSVAVFPVLMLFTDWFSSIGLEHITAVLLSVFAIYLVSKNKTIKRYFAESYEYLFIGMILLACIHLSELSIDVIFKNYLGEYQDIVELTLEHLFFYLGILSISYAFFKVEEPSLDARVLAEAEDGEQKISQ